MLDVGVEIEFSRIVVVTTLAPRMPYQMVRLRKESPGVVVEHLLERSPMQNECLSCGGFRVRVEPR